ncbi:MAG: hypothetical protein JSS75_04500 [Bacteroidetes bacterium]|nr:hypothetical protein [Bacteroidota bacterium]
MRERVCLHCIDSDQYGNCRIGGNKECTIASNFETIVNIIQQTNSERLEDYVGAVRRNICRECEYGSIANCNERDTVECQLDRYLPLVIDVVDQQQGMQFA